MKKKILILGSEGQIGGHLKEFFKNKKGYEVIKFDIILGKSFDLRNFKNSQFNLFIFFDLYFISNY